MTLLSRLGVVVLLLTAGAARAEDKVNFSLSWLPNGTYAYYSAGVLNGFYTDEGIDFKITRGYGSIDVTTKLASNVFTVGEADIAAVITGRVQHNTPVQCIMNSQTMTPHAIQVLTDGGINSIKDLAGRTIATQAGNSILTFLPLLAAKSGLDASKVKIVNVDVAATIPMLVTGKADAVATDSTSLYANNKQAEKVGKKIKPLSFADAGLDMYAICMAANEQTIKDQTDVLRRVIKATLKSRRWAKDHPEETIALHVKMFPAVNPDDALGAQTDGMPFMFNKNTTADGEGAFNPQRLKETYDIVAAAQNLPKDYDVSKIATNAFLPK